MRNSRKKIKLLIVQVLVISIGVGCFTLAFRKASNEGEKKIVLKNDAMDEVAKKIAEQGNLKVDDKTEIAQNNEEEKLENIEEEEKDDDKLKDLDNDGLDDRVEELFGADSSKNDTDGDGLNDYEEIILGLDAASSDSNNNGIEDAKEDSDNDGVINLDEKKAGLNLSMDDTDADGITDGNEINIYKTSPSQGDTDGDGLLDGDEIMLKLDPLNVCSDGVTKDSERKIEQSLSKESISQVALDEECEFKPSVNGTVKGVLNKNVYVNSYDIAPLQDIDGVIGEGVNINSEYKEDEELNLSFDYTNYSNSEDVNKIAICHFENDKYTVLDTVNDQDKKTLSTKINKGGIYFLINKGKSLESKKEDKTENEKLEKGENRFFSDIALLKATPAPVDSDYDGIDDKDDKDPKNNNFSGTLKTDFAKSKVSYSMDYRNFFATNKKYNSSISRVSSLLSSFVYGNKYNDMSIGEFMNQHGLKDVKNYKLTKKHSNSDTTKTTSYGKNIVYNDSDITEAYIGHRKVTYNGETKEIITVVIRGTNASIEEWESNFDIGSTENKATIKEWVVADNHKGFDVASTRVLNCIDEYEKEVPLDKSAKKTYWVTGHSRGAAIANIVGARLVKSSKDVYCYTFASPNTTVANNAEDTNIYKGIYNIVNKDDFIPYLPVKEWQFKHYGKTYIKAISNNYEWDWFKLLIRPYNPNRTCLDQSLNDISKIINERNDAYELSCKCHGNGEDNNVTIRNKHLTKHARENAIKKIPYNMIPYCKITRYDGKRLGKLELLGGWDFNSCQEPEYFMQLLASCFDKKNWGLNTVEFLNIANNIAPKYKEAEKGIVKSALCGIIDPHVTESYYLLSTKL